jgi:predicted nucleotide-binding protein
MLQVSVPIAYELLAQCIRQGEGLVQRASLVGDFSDYESWKAARKQWIDPTVQALEHMYGGPAEAREFAEGATSPEAGKRWQEQYSVDLKCVKQAIELLGTMQGELAFENGSSPPAPAELAAAGVALVADSTEPAAGADRTQNAGYDRGELARETIGLRIDGGEAQHGDAEEPGQARGQEPQTTLESDVLDAPGDERRDQAEPRQTHEPDHAKTHDETGDVRALKPEPAQTPEPEQAPEPEPGPEPTHAPEHTQTDLRSLDRPAVEDAPGEHPEIGSELAPPQSRGSQLAQHTAPSPPSERELNSAPATSRTRDVYLAHGRDERWKQAVEHLLEQAGEHEIKIVNQRSKERAQLTEELREQAPGSHYAVVLLTADDVGGARLESDAEPYFSTRAHQEVVFEMGFLVAALTPGRVCVLYEDGVELPCDLDGVSHVRLDLAGTWQPKLLLHLRRAGFDYDMNKLVSV